MKIDRAGFPFIAAALVPAAALAVAQRARALAASFALLGGFFAYFFRDPERQVPQDADARRVAGRRPRDDCRARATRAGRRRATGSRSRSSCRRWTSTSTARRSRGRVTRIDYRPGKFLPAYNEGSNDNELNEVWIEHDGRTVVFRQVVGMLARRIVCRVREGRRARARRSASA